MRSYIKIYGPPLLKTIKALEKIAPDMPEVCIMNLPLWMTQQMSHSQTTGSDDRAGPFSVAAVRNIFGIKDLPEERCKSIISKSGKSLGEYDFFFEWFKPPTTDQVEILIEKIDETIEPLGSVYTLTTK